ncbi:hypothetical protein GLAREA_06562 [Glarea lozoyensis ATCC 20868]|uniref:Uncharacterized protein n=1 Tax=Glarea lozoyensis (strain ATCC 20868 / MF5171) TaxID=1116229 RepID=S3D8S4_GLAL2|nr:uncharacterized protein GLAREA_06562 [Glarea lozoyensis ATCC 20868]EPE33549.1 hypothetical protein GLAREA_06562 [Glarea lozoyensis ATCC 20868]
MDASPQMRDTSAVPRQRSSHSSTSVDPFSPSAVLMSMHQHHSHTGAARGSYYPSTNSNPYPVTTSMSSYTYPAYTATSSAHVPSHSHGQNQYSSHSEAVYPYSDKDLFRGLREHNISTKTAWTVMPASEGTRVLDLCKSLSVAVEVPSHGSGRSGLSHRAPCYNRETLYDEEWQAHMRDVHGVFFLWPDTWMRRIEVVDLEPYGGDIGGINNLMMEG